jgi:hypothetical protein
MTVASLLAIQQQQEREDREKEEKRRRDKEYQERIERSKVGRRQHADNEIRNAIVIQEGL